MRAGHSQLPRLAERFDGEAPPRTVAQLIQYDVRMDEPGAVLVDPDGGDAVSAGEARDLSEMRENGVTLRLDTMEHFRQA